MALKTRRKFRDAVAKMLGARPAEQGGRLVIVSNRVSTPAQMRSSAGGLAVAMSAALRERTALWFGFSGETSESASAAPVVTRDGALTRALIDLPRADYAKYYGGFANGALWPLFHYRVGVMDFSYGDYEAYLRINEEFARHLVPLLRADDLVWIHDYHLIPLAQMLRAKGVTQRIGFFLHIPFPTPEVLTTLPVHDAIVRALAQYDLVGFHTPKDVVAFTDYLVREKGDTTVGEGWAEAYGRKFKVGAFPIGIDPEAVASRAERSAGSVRSRQLRESLSGRKLAIGVDRLDYTKGLVRRFRAVEQMFETYPEHRRGLVVLQIAPPTRGDVAEYRRVRAELNGLIGHINGRFGEPDLLPVRYLNRQYGQDILFGYLRLSAVGLITPLRDGMNLVAKEYVASQDPEDPGVPVLSRFAGAAQQMQAALIVNPFDVVATANALHQALIMPLEERRERYRTLMDSIRGYDIYRWRDSFVDALSHPLDEGAGAQSELPLPLPAPVDAA